MREPLPAWYKVVQNGWDKFDHREPEFVPKGHCKWCGVKLEGRRTSFCCPTHSSLWNKAVYWHRSGGTYHMMILRRDLFSCQHCGKFAARENKHGIRLPCDGEDLEVHHKIPVASGGSDEPNNLETLCHACHLAAHGRAERKTKTKTPRPEACEWEELQVSNNG